jgi:hypothetical protein
MAGRRARGRLEVDACGTHGSLVPPWENLGSDVPQEQGSDPKGTQCMHGQRERRHLQETQCPEEVSKGQRRLM